MAHALILAAWSLFGSGPHAEQHYTLTVSAAPHVLVGTANGKVTVKTGRVGSAIEVTVTKRADTPDQLKALGAQVQRTGNAVTLRAVYPRNCGTGSCGGEVSFDIVTPPGTELDVSTSNGSITATGIGANARLKSSNGSVNASYASLTGVTEIALSTSNGSISLALPPPVKIGRLRMDTSVGRIASDWPVNVDRSNFVGGSVDQTLVRGATAITLSTTNGSISLKKVP